MASPDRITHTLLKNCALEVARKGGANRAQITVLHALLDCADFRPPFWSRPGLHHLMRVTGYRDRRSVRRPLRWLRDHGHIEAVYGLRGGRGTATVYTFPAGLELASRRLTMPQYGTERGAENAPDTGKTGAENAPLSAEKTGAKNAPDTPKGVQKMHERGAKNAPPPIHPENYEDTPSRRDTGEVAQNDWEEVKARLSIGEHELKAWFDPIEYLSTTELSLTVIAPSAFHSGWVRQHYKADLAQAVRAAGVSNSVSILPL